MSNIWRILLAGLIGANVLFSFTPVSAQSNGRITTTEYMVTYQIYAEAENTITATMTRISGDLIPFLVLRPAGAPDQPLKRGLADNSGRQASLAFQFERNGYYELVATREDAQDGTTTGDFILSIGGVTLVDSDQPQPDDLPVYDHPAIVLASNQVLEGVVNDDLYATYYLVYLSTENIYQVLMDSSEGDLQPALVLLSLDDQILVRSTSFETNASLIYTPGKSGWYIVVATRFDAELGTSKGRYRIVMTTG